MPEDNYVHIDEFKVILTPQQLSQLRSKYVGSSDLSLDDVVRNRAITLTMDWIETNTSPANDMWGRQSLN